MPNTIFGSTTEAIKDTINGSVGSTVDAIDSTRAPIASGIESAASTLHSSAGSLEQAASWLRNKNVQDMWGDVEETVTSAVKTYPVATLLGAVVVGFAAGRLLRR